MGTFVQKIFNLYPGEGKQAFLFSLLAFLWSFGITSALKFSDALFLIHVGSEHLPTVYLISSTGMIGLAIALLYIYHSIDIKKIFTTILLSAVIFYLGIYYCLIHNIGVESGWIWYLIRIVSFQYYTVLCTAYWTFIDQYHHIQDAKRMYVLFSSMIFLGVASTGATMRSGQFEYVEVIAIIVSLFFASATLVHYLSRTSHIVHEDPEQDSSSQHASNSLVSTLRQLASSKFTLLLMSCNFVIYLMWVTTEYNYFTAFDKAFVPAEISPEEGIANADLTLFLGQITAIVSASNLLFGLFFYSRFLRRFGIGAMVLFTPILIVMAYVGWISFESLIFPILGFFVVEGTNYVLDDSNYNILLNAVPHRLKYKVRIFIESFFEPFGMLGSALLLSIPNINTLYLGFVLALMCLTIALALRANYYQSIYHNLLANAIHFDWPLKRWFSRFNKRQLTAERQFLLDQLQQGESQAKIMAAEALLAFDDPLTIETCTKAIRYVEDSDKSAMLHVFAASGHAASNNILQLVYEWYQSTIASPVQGELAFYLAARGAFPTEEAILLLDNEQITLSGAALLAMMQDGQSDYSQRLEQMLQSYRQEDVMVGIAILEALGSHYYVDRLLPFLDCDSLVIQRAAMAAIAALCDRRCRCHGRTILHHLKQTSDSAIRKSCLQALGRIQDSSFAKEIVMSSLHFRPSERRLAEEILVSMGLKSVPIMVAVTCNGRLPLQQRILAGRVLGRLAPPQLHALLQKTLPQEIERAYTYLYYYNNFDFDIPRREAELLREALLSGYHSMLHYIIQLLGAAGEVEDTDLLTRMIRSPSVKIRSQVVETLERTCEHKIFLQMLPLIEESPVQEKNRSYHDYGYPVMTLQELLLWLSQSPSSVDQIAAATVLYNLTIPGWKQTLKKQMASDEVLIHHFVAELLETP
ncbi:MAG: hypothetical protein H7A37_07980 [Chlamydiales bacterium]|nr:hypothetical protein [Chlamydiia bacterium]MCP5508219.1 hypothetical protein [Chlamydiales bacterium]